MDNAAFEDDGELPRILRKLSDRMESNSQEPGDEFYLSDINGNHIGDAKITK